MLNRISIINSLVSKHKYTDYLEIGVRDGECFNAIHCENKVGVDPDPESKATLHMTSDEFFELNTAKFGICFVDGMHEKEQAERDILNCLKVLKKGGTVVVHDCLPTSEFMQLFPQTTQDEWCGDVWKAIVKLRRERDDLVMVTVNTDWGVGVITKGGQNIIDAPDNPTYQEFVANKEYWMNIISPDDFIRLYLR